MAATMESNSSQKEITIPKLEDSSEINEEKMKSLKVLDPDDPLMKRFQEALKAHLMRIDERLKAEILELEASNKEASKKREQKGLEMYEAQREISRQEASIEKYCKSLEDVKQSREEKEQCVKTKKEHLNKVRQDADSENRRVKELTREIESLSSQCKRFEEFEEEISNHLKISKRMSEKDANVQRELIRQKQQKDYFLLKLEQEVWKLEREISDLKKQQDDKNEDKSIVGQTIADAEVDLNALQRERAGLLAGWNRVISNIQQRDKITEELSAERNKIRDAFKTLQSRIEKTKKDTFKEMEKNEQLTELQSRLEEDIQCNLASIGTEKDKADVLEYKILDVARLLEKTEADYDLNFSELQRLKNEDKSLAKELENLGNQKRSLEEEFIRKVGDKITHDKAVMHLSKILRESQEVVTQLELTMLQTENQYSKSLLELEKIKNLVTTEKEDLEELIKRNILKEKELNKVKIEIERCETIIEKKQTKIADLLQKIDEMKTMNGTLDMTTQDLQIASLEKSIEEVEVKNQESKTLWLRQESYMVTLSEQRDTQLQELNRLNRQITIIEQKNLKLKYALEKEETEGEKIDRRVKELRQRLLRFNVMLAEQKELRNNLLDKNFLINDEYTKTLKDNEMELVKLQNEIKELKMEKISLEEQLGTALREYYSWEKKIKLAVETSKIIKEERETGGEVSTMKSEIHKMEIRLSHLKKAQEKMIKDMEFCIARRDVIINEALVKEQKRPREIHNKQVMNQKRMDDRKRQIKQVIKETKKIENEILKLEAERQKLQQEIEESENTLKSYQESISEIDNEIAEGELLKNHKLECLVRKQRKVRLFQKVRDRKYKMLFKSEAALNEEFEKQKEIRVQLSEIMEETNRDFPHLKSDIRKIILTMQSS